jgi:hypothetical protein
MATEAEENALQDRVNELLRDLVSRDREEKLMLPLRAGPYARELTRTVGRPVIVLPLSLDFLGWALIAYALPEPPTLEDLLAEARPR